MSISECMNKWLFNPPENNQEWIINYLKSVILIILNKVKGCSMQAYVGKTVAFPFLFHIHTCSHFLIYSFPGWGCLHFHKREVKVIWFMDSPIQLFIQQTLCGSYQLKCIRACSHHVKSASAWTLPALLMEPTRASTVCASSSCQWDMVTWGFCFFRQIMGKA